MLHQIPFKLFEIPKERPTFREKGNLADIASVNSQMFPVTCLETDKHYSLVMGSNLNF